MARLTGPQSLVKMTCLLGGPFLESTDIDWATDLPAGNAFFEWLADQLHDWSTIPASPTLEQTITLGNAVEDNNEGKLEMRMCAALREVALEKDEVLILSHDSSLRDASNDTSDSDYVPLSRLKKQASYINNETELLKRETDLLSARLALSKKASQKLTQAIKSLQQTLDEVKSDTRNAEERLSELSVNADTTITTTLTNTKTLIYTLNISDPDDNANTTRAVERSNDIPNYDHDKDKDVTNQHARCSLVRAKTSLTTIIADLRERTEKLSLIRKEAAFKNEDIQMEANRLKAAFGSMKSGTSKSYVLTKDPELEDICALLEHEAASRERGETPTDLLQDFLQELDRQEDNSEVVLEPSVVDVDAEINNARCLDQIALLEMYENGLDQALNSLNVMLAPLERLHASLARVWHCVQEAEALLEAFRDEVEDIVMDFVNESLGDSHKVQSKEHDHNDTLNPSSVASLQNILTEDLARKKRLVVMETSEKAWIEALIHEYSARPIHPSLPYIYANSPLTTSAPFALPTQVQEIEAQARDRAMKLENLVRKLEVEVQETFTKNDPTAKRLDTFVERWCGSVPK